LKYYDNNAERLLNALCENTVPEHLQEESLKPAVTNERSEQEKSNAVELTSSTTFNVYDYDRFDLFHRDDVDLQHIHRGKK
jgi:hypothetical protein